MPELSTPPKAHFPIIWGWKGIADVFGIHRVTAWRWGRDKGLPFWRNDDGMVYSYAAELLSWWAARERRLKKQRNAQ